MSNFDAKPAGATYQGATGGRASWLNADDSDVARRTPAQRAAEGATRDRADAERLERDIAGLAMVTRDEWPAAKRALDERARQLQGRLTTPAAAADAAIDAEREATAAAMSRAMAALAVAAPPPAFPALPGEDGVAPGVRDKSAEPVVVLMWLAQLAPHQRTAMIARYQQATAAKPAGVPADDFAIAFANYVAAHRIAEPVTALGRLDRRGLARWIADHQAAVSQLASHAGDADPRPADDAPANEAASPQAVQSASASRANAATQAAAPVAQPPAAFAMPLTELAAKAKAVVEAGEQVQIALYNQRVPTAAIARVNSSLQALSLYLHQHAGTRSPSDDAAIKAAVGAGLGVANALALRDPSRSKIEVELRRNVGEIDAVLKANTAREAVLESPLELAAKVRDNLAALEEIRATIAANRDRLPALAESELAKAIAATTEWQTALQGDPHAAERLARAIVDQQELVLLVSAELKDVWRQPVSVSYAETVDAYLHTLALSTGRRKAADAALDRARTLRRLLAVERIRASLDTDQKQLAALGTLDGEAAAAGKGEGAALAQRTDRAAARIAAGGSVGRGELADLEHAAREQEFLHRVQVLRLSAQQTRDVMESVRGALDVPILKARNKLDDLVADLTGLPSAYRLWISDDKRYEMTDAEIRREEDKALDILQARLRRTLIEGEYQKTLAAAQAIIKEEIALRFLEQLVVIIAITLTGNAVGAVARGAAEGVMVARTGAVVLEGDAAFAVAAVGTGADAAFNAVAQKYLQGDDASLTTLLAVNVLTPLAIERVMGVAKTAEVAAQVEARALEKADEVAAGARGLGQAAEEIEAIGWSSKFDRLAEKEKWIRRGRSAGLVLAAGTRITGEMIIGAAVDYATRLALEHKGHPPDQQTAASWLMQGAAIAIGRHLSGNVMAIKRRLQALETWSAERTHLLTRSSEINDRARQLEQTHDMGAANDIIGQYVDLVSREHALLERELLAIIDGHGHISKLKAEALLRSNRRAMTELRDLAAGEFIHGEEPGDAGGGKRSQGSAAEVAERADVATRVGLDVTHDVSDPTSHKATISDGADAVTVEQERRGGRLPESKSPEGPEELARRKRMIEAVRRTVAARQTLVQAELAMRTHLRSAEVQVGAGPQGALHQGVQTPMLAPIDFATRLVVGDASQPSTMFTKGEQKIGQPAGALDGPGLPTRETTLAQDEGYMTSGELEDAAVLGMLEAQATMVDGRLVGPLEARPTALPQDGPWHVADVSARRRLRLPSGHELWVYSDHFVDMTGPGEGKLGTIGDVTDAASLTSGLADSSIVAGADPHLAARMIRGGRVLAVPGSPTGDWAAETAALGSNQVDVVGDVSPRSRKDSVDPTTGAVTPGWETRIRDAQASGDPAKLAEVRAAMTKEAHPGQRIPRNRIPGAAGDHPSIHLETGQPVSVTRLPDGRYEVVMADIVTGDLLPAQIYDQIVYGYGQSKASYLEETFGPAPKDGRLEPMYYDDARTQYIGLRDPATGYVLRGAAAANVEAAPWVKAVDRQKWLVDMRRVVAGTEMFDGRPLSGDSDGVADGIEIARDRVQRGKVQEDRTDYRLPGTEFELELGSDVARWSERVRAFVIDQVPAAPPDKVVVKTLSGGASGDAVFEVSIDGKPMGIWKVFRAEPAARGERAILKLLNDAQLGSMRAPRERGGMGAAQDGREVGESVLMDKAPGTSLEDLALGLPKDPDVRAHAMQKFRQAAVRTAQGLAEMHARFANPDLDAAGRRAARKSDADYLVNNKLVKNQSAIAAVGGAENAARIRHALLSTLYQRFLDADLPPSAYHGDAHISNFKVDGWDPVQKQWRDLYTFDVGTMKFGFPQGQDLDSAKNPLGDKPAAGGDLGRLLESLQSKLPEGTLTQREIDDVRRQVILAYRRSFEDAITARAATRHDIDPTKMTIDPAALEVARIWYSVETEIAGAKGNPEALRRIENLLGVRLDVTSPATGSAP